jgi:BirA family biotin operon repressor/biotin-[acetyl-CoA-carboxylase] ligase
VSLEARWEGEPTSTWRERWQVPVLEVHDLVGSTNDRARELSAPGCALPAVVIAEAQSAGRGRAGARWHSPPGVGLWMSLALRLEGSASAAFPLQVGLAAAAACEQATPGLRVGIKWPNDLFVEGRKVGGVLCERVTGAVVAGVGVNVRQRPEDFPDALALAATSLEATSGCKVSRARLASALVARLSRLSGAEIGALGPAVLSDLAGRDVLCGRPVWTRQAGEGKACGIAPDGALLVEDRHGSVQRVVAGSVRAL